MGKTITMKSARALFANRVLVSAAVPPSEAGEAGRPRVRRCMRRGRSFRLWAKGYFAGDTNLSPKLHLVVHGKAA